MERKPSRVEAFLDREEDLDCAGELVRLARGEKAEEAPSDSVADETVYADTQRLAEELVAEYAALSDAIETLRR
jgi:hypothetical protein